MSLTEDEARGLDAGWDDEEPAENEVDGAWDGSAPVARASTPSMAPATEEVDSGWDDAPAGTPDPGSGKRRPHRQRRAKTNALPVSSNPVLLPRPAEPSKKHHREHARKQRAYEAQVKEQRKAERKAQRAAELREGAAARLRQAEAEEAERKARVEARERARSERPAPKPRAKVEVASNTQPRQARTAEVKAQAPKKPAAASKRAFRPGVAITLAVLAAIVALVLLNK